MQTQKANGAGKTTSEEAQRVPDPAGPGLTPKAPRLFSHDGFCGCQGVSDHARVGEAAGQFAHEAFGQAGRQLDGGRYLDAAHELRRASNGCEVATWHQAARNAHGLKSIEAIDSAPPQVRPHLHQLAAMGLLIGGDSASWWAGTAPGRQIAFHIDGGKVHASTVSFSATDGGHQRSVNLEDPQGLALAVAWVRGAVGLVR